MDSPQLQPLLDDLTGGDDEAAEQASKALAAQGEVALPALIALLSAPDEDSRWWAVRALAECPAPGATAAMREALDDPSPAVRQAALLGLRLRPEAESLPRLAALLEDRDSLCAAMAADALAALGGEALPALIEVLQSGSFPAQVEAARALAEIGDPRAIPALYAAGEQGSTLLDYWISIGLDKMGVGTVFFEP
jgi:HEAT repeat protein